MCAPIFLAAAFSGTLAISDRTEFRVRDPGDDPSQASLDLESLVRARLALQWEHESLTLEYDPRFVLWDLNLPTAIQGTVLNAGGVRAEWWHKLVRLSLDESASYGGMNLASLTMVPGLGATPQINVVPVSRVIEYVASMTSFQARVELRRWTLQSMVGFQLSGGVNEIDREYLPFQYGPTAEIRADYLATPRSHFITVLVGSESIFSSGPEAGVAGLEERWHYELSHTTRTRLALGAAVTRSREGVDLPYDTEAYPVGEASIENRRALGDHDDRFVFNAMLRISPMVNPLLGLVDERLQGTIGAGWTHRRLSLNAFVGAQQTVPPDAANAVRLFIGDLTGSWAPYPSLAFDAGLRVLAQTAIVPTANAPPAEVTFLQAIVFVGVTLRAPTVRF